MFLLARVGALATLSVVGLVLAKVGLSSLADTLILRLSLAVAGFTSFNTVGNPA